MLLLQTMFKTLNEISTSNLHSGSVFDLLFEMNYLNTNQDNTDTIYREYPNPIHESLPTSTDEPVQLSSIRFLTCTFRASCYNSRLSWAHTPFINLVVSRTDC